MYLANIPVTSTTYLLTRLHNIPRPHTSYQIRSQWVNPYFQTLTLINCQTILKLCQFYVKKKQLQKHTTMTHKDETLNWSLPSPPAVTHNPLWLHCVISHECPSAMSLIGLRIICLLFSTETLHFMFIPPQLICGRLDVLIDTQQPIFLITSGHTWRSIKDVPNLLTAWQIDFKSTDKVLIIPNTNTSPWPKTLH